MSVNLVDNKYMFMFFISFIKKTNGRTKQVIQSAFSLIFVKGISLIVNLALIPVTLNLLGTELFGVWILIFSIVNWLNFFDIGIGNGLRNICAQAFVKNHLKKLKKNISSAYIFLAFVSILLLLFYFLFCDYVDWGLILNAPKEVSSDLPALFNVIIPLFLLTFVTKLISNILTADLRPAFANSIFTISNLIILTILLSFESFFSGALLRVGVLYLFTPFLVSIGFNLFLFSTKYRFISPSLGYFDFSTAKNLLSTGARFFIVQIAVLVIFQTDNLIISHVLAPKEVTSYNIVFRYFGLVSMSMALLLSPLWSAYSNALASLDYVWMNRAFKKSCLIFFPSFVLISTMAVFHKPLLKLWVGESIVYNRLLIFGMAAYTGISIWNNIFANFLNGVGLIRGQMFTSLAAAIINIPLSVFLAKKLGSSGVIIASCVCLSFFMVLGPIQTYQYFKEKV